MCYGIGYPPELTNKEVAKFLSFSEEKTRLIKIRAVNKLNVILTHRGVEL